jgi:hypothetical protein
MGDVLMITMGDADAKKVAFGGRRVKAAGSEKRLQFAFVIMPGVIAFGVTKSQRHFRH